MIAPSKEKKNIKLSYVLVQVFDDICSAKRQTFEGDGTVSVTRKGAGQAKNSYLSMDLLIWGTSLHVSQFFLNYKLT